MNRLKNRRRAALGKNVAIFLFGAGVALGVVIHHDAGLSRESQAAVDSMQALQQEVLRCFPSDVGEKSVLTLAVLDGVMKLQCEKHALPSLIQADQPLYSVSAD